MASRGLDIPDVGMVVNYNLPRNPADYVHRVGRTARAGKEGLSVSLVGQRDVGLVQEIEKFVAGGGKGRAAEGKEVDEESEGSKHDESGVPETAKMVLWEEEGVNLETRVTRGRTLKDVGEARMEAMRGIEGGKDQWGRRTGKKAQRRS